MNIVTYLTLTTIASLPDLAGSILRSKDLSAFQTAFREINSNQCRINIPPLSYGLISPLPFQCWEMAGRGVNNRKKKH